MQSYALPARVIGVKLVLAYVTASAAFAQNFPRGCGTACPSNVERMLLRRRTGRTAALVVALGFGGGMTVLGVGTALLGPTPGASFFPALTGYLLATSPLYLLAALIAVCKSELWFEPSTRTLRLLTYRPWLRRPRVEEAPVSEYSGVRIDAAPEDEGGGVLVSLVTTGGDAVPLRQFTERNDAAPFAEQLAKATGLWLRDGLEGDEKSKSAGGGEAHVS